MLTNRAPFEYLYLSRRLLADLVRNDEAVRPRTRRTFSFGAFGQRLTATRRAPDYDSVQDLAARSLDLVDDHLGGLDRVWETYVHAEVDLYRGVFAPHMGWDGGEVACFRADLLSVDDRSSVFVALFGSASNLTGYRAKPGADHGFYPSDIAGLYSLLDAIREPGDPETDLDYRLHDQSLDPATRVDEAIMFAQGGARLGPQRLEFLARRLLYEESFDGLHGTYDCVIVGAPLWVRTPKPTASPGGVPGKARQAFVMRDVSEQ